MGLQHSPDRTTDAVRLVSVCKHYGTDANPVMALDDVTLGVRAATLTAVMGPSGSGKSTMLNVAAGLDVPSSGQVFIGGTLLNADSETALTKFRRQRVGFVFQKFNLLPMLTIEENVELPLRLAGRRVDTQQVRELIGRVGLGDRLGAFPAELSGGQQQRAAIARALVTEPAVIFADEPTGALDSQNARQVLGLLRRAVDTFNQTVVLVTHDPVAAAYADVVIFLVDGRVVGEMTSPTSEAVAERLATLGDLLDSNRIAA